MASLQDSSEVAVSQEPRGGRRLNGSHKPQYPGTQAPPRYLRGASYRPRYEDHNRPRNQRPQVPDFPDDTRPTRKRRASTTPEFTSRKEGDREDSRPYKRSRPRTAVRKEEPSQGESITKLREKIRNLRRLLEHPGSTMPAGVRLEKERELANYEQDLKPLLERRDRKELISKYHFVRFLERRRAMKNLKLLRQEENQANQKPTDERNALLSKLTPKIHEAEVDLDYTIYAPLNEKYISLFPPDPTRPAKKPAHPETDPRNLERGITAYTILDNATGEKPPSWFGVEKCREEGTLELLREGKLSRSGEKTSTTLHGAERRGRAKRNGGGGIRLGVRPKSETAMTLDGDESEESDGGFFQGGVKIER